MTITLYAAPMSSATPVVNALEELDVPHELVLIDLASGDQRKADFLAHNPNGKVPTLLVDGVAMFEALAIMQWLGDRYGVERGMWPAADAPERLEALSWSTWAYVTFGAIFQRLILASSERVDAALHHEGQAEHARKELQDLLAILDRRLDSRDYLLGDAFTLVDLIVGNAITYAAFIGVPTTSHDHVEAWLARFHERPAYKKAWAVAS
jgi:GST-like protein